MLLLILLLVLEDEALARRLLLLVLARGLLDAHIERFQVGDSFQDGVQAASVLVFIVADLDQLVGLRHRCAALLRFSGRLLLLDQAVDAERRVLCPHVDLVARSENRISLDNQLRRALGLAVLLRFL